MEPIATETTNPATADFGMRTFEARLSETCIIEIVITQRIPGDCPSDIHATDELLLSDQLVTNEQLRTALGLLTLATVHADPTADSLP